MFPNSFSLILLKLSITIPTKRFKMNYDPIIMNPTKNKARYPRDSLFRHQVLPSRVSPIIHDFKPAFCCDHLKKREHSREDIIEIGSCILPNPSLFQAILLSINQRNIQRFRIFLALIKAALEQRNAHNRKNHQKNQTNQNNVRHRRNWGQKRINHQSQAFVAADHAKWAEGP